ncbi:palmitoyl-protein thioesterase 2 [Pelomyxa schiedti]|nr:palmitoyl-protein thioesterase 2 [Pelomyxa schiedti]
MAARLAVVVATVVIMGWCAAGYKPVMMMHGYSMKPGKGSYTDWNDWVSWLAEDHPGQIVVPLNVDNSVESGKPLWTQVDDLAAIIEQTIASDSAFEQGYHLVGHSQGGLLTRCILELMSDLHVDQYLSLAGLQGGLYGLADWEYENVTDEIVTDLLYTAIMQDDYSIANSWRTPNYSRYMANNEFLPYLNNERADNYTEAYKTNFIKVNHLNLFGSSADGYIVPWYTSLFDFFDEDENRESMTVQKYYTADTFGLQTMDLAGRLSRTAVDGVTHSGWLHNRTAFELYLLPLLQ